MSGMAEKIAAAKKAVEDLKQKMLDERAQLHDTTLDKAADAVEAIKVPQNKFKSRRNLSGHLGKIFAMHWSANENFVSAAQDGKLLVWNSVSSLKLHVIPLKSQWVMTCGYAPSGRFVASGGLDNVAAIFNLASEGSTKPVRELMDHNGYVSCCRFIKDSKMVTSSADTTSILWDVEVGARIHEMKGHRHDVMSLAVSEDKNYIVTGACDMEAKYWDLRTGGCIRTYFGHESDINSVDFLSNGTSFGTGSDDSTCRVWDVRAGSELIRLGDDSVTSGITSVAFSKSGRYLFSGDEQAHCNVWDTLKGSLAFTIPNAHADRISCLGVSQDGMALATGSWDTYLKIWA